jgi:hypothetical protein
MADLPTPRDLHAKSQSDLLQFLRTELSLCSTFAELAVTDLDAPEDARQALAKAESGCSNIERFLPQFDGPEKQAIEQALVDLRKKLDSIWQQLE